MYILVMYCNVKMTCCHFPALSVCNSLLKSVRAQLCRAGLKKVSVSNSIEILQPLTLLTAPLTLRENKNAKQTAGEE